MKSNFYSITLSSEITNLIEDALELTGKVEFTKENPTMEIPIKGKLILYFGENVTDNRTIELRLSEWISLILK